MNNIFNRNLGKKIVRILSYLVWSYTTVFTVEGAKIAKNTEEKKETIVSLVPTLRTKFHTRAKYSFSLVQELGFNF